MSHLLVMWKQRRHEEQGYEVVPCKMCTHIVFSWAHDSSAQMSLQDLGNSTIWQRLLGEEGLFWMRHG